MKKIIVFILLFCFTSTVCAKDLSNQDTSINYSLSERIEENEEDKSGALQYFILIVAFLGISAFFLILKDNDD